MWEAYVQQGADDYNDDNANDNENVDAWLYRDKWN